MAKFNEILVGRFNRALQKLTGIKGVVPAPQLSSEIMSVIPLFFGVENRYLESWNRFASFSSLTGGAAQFAVLQLRAPAPVGNPSNLVVVVEKIMISVSVAQLINVRVDGSAVSTDFATTEPNIAQLDGRAPSKSTALLTSSSVQGATIQSDFPAPLLAANTSFDLIVDENQEVPLIGTLGTGGASLRVSTSIAAAGMNVSLVWRERLLEESERI